MGVHLRIACRTRIQLYVDGRHVGSWVHGTNRRHRSRFGMTRVQTQDVPYSRSLEKSVVRTRGLVSSDQQTLDEVHRVVVARPGVGRAATKKMTVAVHRTTRHEGGRMEP